jgi:hypothetical protein
MAQPSSANLERLDETMSETKDLCCFHEAPFRGALYVRFAYLKEAGAIDLSSSSIDKYRHAFFQSIS